MSGMVGDPVLQTGGRERQQTITKADIPVSVQIVHVGKMATRNVDF